VPKNQQLHVPLQRRTVPPVIFSFHASPLACEDDGLIVAQAFVRE
jgi:hypothetical protein